MRRLTRLVGRGLLVLLALGLGLGVWVWAGLPSRSAVRNLQKQNPGRTTLMQQRVDEAADAKKAFRIRQQWVPISRISRNLIHAVLTGEDAKFFGHEGVDWEAVQHSLEHDLREGRFARGGSTITQQLAKNLFFTTRKDPLRKVREVIVSRWLEEDLGKRRILEIYLNVIEWGDGVFGAEAAARRWYGKPAAALTEAEAAGLAAMIPSPRRLNPAVEPRAHGRRQKRILWLMARAGYMRQSLGNLGEEPPEEAVPEDDAPPPETMPPSPAEAATEPPSPEPAPEGEAPVPEPAASPSGLDSTPPP